MPFQPDVPPTGQIEAPKEDKNLGTYHIHRFTVNRDPNDESSVTIKVRFSRGYIENSVYYPVEWDNIDLQGEDVVSKISESTSGGTIYNEVKYALWQILQAREKVPAGSIT
jgi:hypothetical protein